MYPFLQAQANESPILVHIALALQLSNPAEHMSTTTHTLGEPLQSQPLSMLHIAKHPSPLTVFPSSQSSTPLTIPSPHTPSRSSGAHPIASTTPITKFLIFIRTP